MQRGSLLAVLSFAALVLGACADRGDGAAAEPAGSENEVRTAMSDPTELPARLELASIGQARIDPGRWDVDELLARDRASSLRTEPLAEEVGIGGYAAGEDAERTIDALLSAAEIPYRLRPPRTTWATGSPAGCVVLVPGERYEDAASILAAAEGRGLLERAAR